MKLRVVMTKKKLKELKGSGALFGGGKSHSPTEEDDSSYSSSRAYLVEVLGEGEIEGLLDGNKSIYLNETPVQNSDNTTNFKGFKARPRKGTFSQKKIPIRAMNTPTAEVAVNQTVTKSTPITRTITNAQCDLIRVRVGVRLVKYEKDGDIVGSDITFRIFIKQGSGAFVLRKERKVKGKFSSFKEFEWTFDVDNLSGAVNTFQVRVERVTGESTSSKDIRTLQWQAYTEIVDAKLRYPHTALVGLQFRAEQFNSIPSRLFRVGGMLVKIPTNMTVRVDRSLAWNGLAWDGNFRLTNVAINDPVWQLYEILINKRWGLGNYIDAAKIDKWSLYEASKYNNELLDNGLGGTEARYQCSTVVNTPEKVYDVIQALCSSCNIKPYWAEGTLFFWQDRPTPVTRQFTQADVYEGEFTYSSTSVRSRYTLANVTWNDPDDLYKQAVEPVEDTEASAKYGLKETQIVAYGCCSRSQAIRVGKWILFSGRYQNETVTFASRAYGALVRPGDVIQVADAKRAALRMGGLIKSATTTSVTTDFAVQVLAGSTLTVMLPTGVLETRTMGVTGLISELSVTTPFSQVPQPESNWIVSTPNLKPQLFRVLSVTPTASDPTKVDILGIKHFDGKYDAVEKDIKITLLPNRLNPPLVPSKPDNILCYLVGMTSPTAVDNVLDFKYSVISDWDVPKLNGSIDPFTMSYISQYRRGEGGDWTADQNTILTDVKWDNIQQGSYYTRVAAIDVNGKSSQWVTSTASTIYTYHPDTINYYNRLISIGVTISDLDIYAIDKFVKGCYALGYYPPNGNFNYNNQINSPLFPIHDCCLFAGNSLNGVKLWYRDDTPSTAILNNFVASDWSRARGLDPGDVDNNNKSLDTGLKASNLIVTGSGVPVNNGLNISTGFFSTKESQEDRVEIFIHNSSNVNNYFAFYIRTLANNTSLVANNLSQEVFNNGPGGNQYYSNSASQPNFTSRGFFAAASYAMWNQGIDAQNSLIMKRNGADINNTSMFGRTQAGSTVTSNVFLFNGSKKSCGMYVIGGIGDNGILSFQFNTLVQELMTSLGRT